MIDGGCCLELTAHIEGELLFAVSVEEDASGKDLSHAALRNLGVVAFVDGCSDR